MSEPRPPGTAEGAPHRVDALLDELEELATQLSRTVDRLREHAAATAKQRPEETLMQESEPAPEPTALQVAVDNLDRRVGDMQTDVRGVGRQVRRRTMVIGVCLALIVIVLASTVPAMVVVSLQNRDAIVANNRKLCPMIAVLVPLPGDPAPRDERAERIRSDATRLYQSRDFDCPSLPQK